MVGDVLTRFGDHGLSDGRDRHAAERAQAYADNARSAATRLAYAGDWKRFCAWCAERDVQPPTPGGLVAIYLAELADQGKKASTIGRALAAISQAHALLGDSEIRRSPAVREVLAGIRRRLAELGVRPEGKSALVLEQLRKVSETVPNWVIGQRDRAVLVFGFAGSFRRSELAALDLLDLELGAEGYRVKIRRSKTDQLGAGRVVGVPYGSNPITCPVRCLQAWLELADIGTGRVFRSIDRHGNIGKGLTGRAIAEIVKRRAAAAGLDPRMFSGHSLRSGFVTTAARAGKSPKAIMDQTGHRTLEMVMRYVRDAKIFEDNAAMGIGL